MTIRCTESARSTAGRARARGRARGWLLVLAGAVALAAPAGCDRRPEANGGPRIEALLSERPPYPPITDLPPSTRGVTASAEQFVVVEPDELVRLGTRGITGTTEVSTDELLRAFWRLRGDPLGGRGAASPSAAPLLLAGARVPAGRVVDVVMALWHHGARLGIGGGVPGAAREHPVRLLGAPAQAAREVHGAIVELGPAGLALSLPGEEPRSVEGCGASPDTACLARALDAAAQSGAKTVFLRRAP
jgi:hypothetical protein